MNILDTIIAKKRKEVAVRKSNWSKNLISQGPVFLLQVFWPMKHGQVLLLSLNGSRPQKVSSMQRHP
jgi:hypothetical protein